jgi:hypothetical protein
VQITGTNRAELDADDLLGETRGVGGGISRLFRCLCGAGAERGAPHRGTRYRNWAGECQVRPFTAGSGELVLRAPRMQFADGSTMVNEPAWPATSANRLFR